MLGAQLCFHSCSERVGKELGDKISLEMRNTWNILASLTIPHIFLMLGVKNALFALFMLTQISKLRCCIPEEITYHLLLFQKTIWTLIHLEARNGN